jgi:hypothetical protein
VSARTEAELARKEDLVGRSLAGSSTGGTNAGVELPRPQAGPMPSGDSWLRPRGGGRAVCSSRIPGEGPGGDGPGVVLMSSFRVEILRPRRRPRLGRTSPKV